MKAPAIFHACGMHYSVWAIYILGNGSRPADKLRLVPKRKPRKIRASNLKNAVQRCIDMSPA